MFHHLTCEERDLLAQLHHQGYRQDEIAAALKRSPSTISRELRRNATDGVYHAAAAHKRAQRKRRERPRLRKMERPEINAYVRRGLASFWSPDQIAGRAKRDCPQQPERHIAPQTIYDWIERQHPDERAHWQGFLRRRGRRRRPKPDNPQNSAANATLADRPQAIQQRRRLGDFEGDTVLGPPGTGGLITLVDRRSRYTLIAKTKNKESRRVQRRIRQRLAALLPHQRRSLTFDNGTEFAQCDRLEQSLGVQVYSAQPGCPYQRGTNENTNGLIRQFYPKGTDFRTVSHVDAARTEKLLNDRPRACLDYRTPREVFYKQFAHSGCD
jgi:IS30 family transposase